MVAFTLLLAVANVASVTGDCLLIDGNFGSDTRTAFQRFLGVSPADGDFGSQSRKKLQMFLNSEDVGAGLQVDGDLGGLTIAALQVFLDEHGAIVAVDGDLGSGTTRALQIYLNSQGASVSVDGNLGPHTVEALQTWLNANSASVAVDGNWGGETTRALQVFLNAHGGLSVDGDLGQNTIDALQIWLHRKGFGIAVDGDFGSETTRALQSFLNSASLKTTLTKARQGGNALWASSGHEARAIEQCDACRSSSDVQCRFDFTASETHAMTASSTEIDTLGASIEVGGDVSFGFEGVSLGFPTPKITWSASKTWEQSKSQTTTDQFSLGSSCTMIVKAGSNLTAYGKYKTGTMLVPAVFTLESQDLCGGSQSHDHEGQVSVTNVALLTQVSGCTFESQSCALANLIV